MISKSTQNDKSVVAKILRDYLIETGDSDIMMMAKQEATEELERREILDKHAQLFSTRIITEEGRKPRYETYVRVDGKRKPIRRNNLKELEDAIVKFYSSDDGSSNVVTVESLYGEWREFRIATKSPSTVHKDDWVWQQYYAHSPIIKTNVKFLTAHDITVWMMSQVKKIGLTKRQFREMKSLLNNVLDFAVEKDILNRNPAREIHGISPQLFEQTEQTSRDLQIFNRDDQRAVVEYCCDKYIETDNVIYLGIVLNFLIGVRVGELAAIKFSDINLDERTLTLQRSEVANKADVAGKMRSSGTKVISHLKKGHRSRPVPLSDTAINIINLIRENYIRKGIKPYSTGKKSTTTGIKNDWLLLNPRGERATKAAISDTIGRINKALNLPNKGNHAIRKTVITEMIRSMMFTQKEIQTYFGHEDFSTTSKYYDFALNDVTENAHKMELALGNNLTGWVTALGNTG